MTLLTSRSLGGKMNRAISDKSPAIYLPPLMEKRGQACFEAQAIPTDPELLKVENYKQFLVERRKRVAQQLNSFLGVL